MNFDLWIKDILEQRIKKPSKWCYICNELLRPQDGPPDNPGIDTISLEFLHKVVNKQVADKGVFGAAAIPRPYYLAMADTLRQSCNQGGKLPSLLLANQLNMLTSSNTARLEAIEGKLASIVQRDKNDWPQMLTEFLFEYLEPEDWRIWLLMRTTVGTRDWKIMPPSLNECLTTFTTMYRKQSSKVTRRLQPQQHVLTVGAKALSKHYHRDRQVGFWGHCIGNEATKNQCANIALLKILFNAVWINLHSLPHDQAVYEIREKEGYGARWTTTIPEEGERATWLFRGFLEPQMEGGHDVGWVHD